MKLLNNSEVEDYIKTNGFIFTRVGSSFIIGHLIHRYKDVCISIYQDTFFVKNAKGVKFGFDKELLNLIESIQVLDNIRRVLKTIK